MPDLEKVIYGIERCLCHVPDACRDCGYDEKSYDECEKELMRDALSLLKAQEPKVMTLEEVKNSEVVYLEDYADPDDGVSPIIRPAINVEVKNGGIFMLDSISCEEGYIFSVDDDYGKFWRCWTSRPTDEQRKAVKWDV